MKRYLSVLGVVWGTAFSCFNLSNAWSEPLNVARFVRPEFERPSETSKVKELGVPSQVNLPSERSDESGWKPAGSVRTEGGVKSAEYVSKGVDSKVVPASATSPKGAVRRNESLSELDNDDFSNVVLQSSPEGNASTSELIPGSGYKDVVTIGSSKLNEKIDTFEVVQKLDENRSMRQIFDASYENNVYGLSFQEVASVLATLGTLVSLSGTQNVSGRDARRKRSPLNRVNNFANFITDLSYEANRSQIVNMMEIVETRANELAAFLVDIRDHVGVKIGTGILVDKDDHVFVLTCRHVVEPYTIDKRTCLMTGKLMELYGTSKIAEPLEKIDVSFQDRDYEVDRYNLAKTTVIFDNNVSVDTYECYYALGLDLVLLPLDDIDANAVVVWDEVRGSERVETAHSLINVARPRKERVVNVGYVKEVEHIGNLYRINGLRTAPGYSGSPVVLPDGSFEGIVTECAFKAETDPRKMSEDVPVSSILPYKSIDLFVNVVVTAL